VLQASAGHSALVHMLLKAGGDPCIADVVQDTPLHAAVRGGHAECVQYLLAGQCVSVPLSVRTDMHG
jgi:ankyrin repeat protein